MKRLENTFLHEGGWKRAIPFVMLFLYCVTIYQFVFLQYDDYFFGSLSAFGYTEPGVAGSDFTFAQLFHFATVLYQTRLPRVLSLVFINAPLLRLQWLYRIINALGITLLFWGVYLFSGAKKNVTCAILSVVFFGLLSQRMYTEGAFWFTACLITFNVNAIMLLSVLLFKRLDTVTGNRRSFVAIGCCALSLITCLMQEITAFTLCGTLTLIILYKLLKEKRIPTAQCIVWAFAVLGAVAICFGPGNLYRFENEAIATLSNRIAVNLDGFIATVFHKSNMPFLIVFFLFVSYLNYKQETARKKSLPSITVWLWSIAFIPVSIYYSPDSTLNILNYNYTVRSAVFVSVGLVYLGYALFLIARELMEIKDLYLTAFGVAGLLSIVSAFFYSTYIAHRMEICFYLSLFCIMLRVFSEEKDMIPKVLTLGGVSMLACLWLAVFWIGYANNAPILRENQETLVSTKVRVAAGEPIVSPTINSGYDHYFTVEFVYPGEPGCPKSDNDIHAMKEYYGLPDDIDINYLME